MLSSACQTTPISSLKFEPPIGQLGPMGLYGQTHVSALVLPQALVLPLALSHIWVFFPVQIQILLFGWANTWVRPYFPIWFGGLKP